MPLKTSRTRLQQCDRIAAEIFRCCPQRVALLVPFVLLAALLASTTPANATTRCTLTAKTPKLLPSGDVRMYGWTRCRGKQARSVGVVNGAILASGRKVTLNGNGTSCLRGTRKRCGFLETMSCEQLTHRRWQMRYGSVPTAVFVRVTLFRGGSGKVLKRKDSRAVPLAELCPEQTQ